MDSGICIHRAYTVPERQVPYLPIGALSKVCILVNVLTHYDEHKECEETGQAATEHVSQDANADKKLLAP